MTTHNSHPIAQSAQKNQLHYHHRLFNAFECPVIPFLRNEPCDRRWKSRKRTSFKKQTSHVSSKLKDLKNYDKPIVWYKTLWSIFPRIPQLPLYIYIYIYISWNSVAFLFFGDCNSTSKKEFSPNELLKQMKKGICKQF